MSVRLSPVITTTSRSMGSLSVHSLELGDGRADPVIVFDDFRVSGRPFGPHPHAGFSAVTYVLRESPGSLRNRDSLGGHAVVGPGGACWLEAGSGAEHEEIPADSGKPIHGHQIFVNLRSKHKASPPRSLSVHAEQVPIWRSDDGGAVVLFARSLTVNNASGSIAVDGAAGGKGSNDNNDGCPTAGGSGMGGGGGGFPNAGDPILHDRLLGDPEGFARYQDVLHELITGAAAPAQLEADILAVEALLGDRIAASALQDVRDNLVQRESTILAGLDSPTGCVE